jgi:hypothetical protein
MSDTPRTIWRNPNPRRAGHAGNPPTFQVIQQADGRLNTRRLKAASPLQTAVRPRRRGLSTRAGLLLLVVLLALMAFVAGRASAHAGEIGEPPRSSGLVTSPSERGPGGWCQVSAPQLPASADLNCIRPRVYIPLVVSGGRHESGDQSDRNSVRVADAASAGNDGRPASAIGDAIGVNRALLSSDGSVTKGSGSRLR